MASAADRAQADVCEGAAPSFGRSRRNPLARGADGGGESHLGLHADPRRTEERGASGRTIDDRSNPQGAGDPAGAGATDVVASVSAGALGRDRGRGFLHHGGLDLAGLVTYYTVFVI